MKKKLWILLTAVCVAFACVLAVACNEPAPAVDYGTMTIADITLQKGESSSIRAEFSKPEYAMGVTYAFDGTDITIANGIVTGNTPGTTTTVTATTRRHTATFTVTVEYLPSLTLTAPEEIFLDYPAVPVSVTLGDPTDTQEIVYTVEDVPDGVTVTVADGMLSAKGTLNGSTERVTEQVRLKASTADGTLEDEVTLKITRYNGAGYNGGSLNMHDRASSFVSEMEAYCGLEGGEKGGTLFVGDSFFDGFWPIGSFRSSYEGQGVYRWGVSSSTLADWLIFAERVVFPFEPKNVVIHCGTNDYYDDRKNADAIVAMAKQLFDSLHARIDGVKVWYFGIEPRKLGTGMQDYSEPLKVNAALKTYAEQNAEWLTYIDSPAWCFTDASRTTINASFYANGDNVHPAHSSYALYVDALQNAGMVTQATAGVETGAMLGFETTKEGTIATTTRALYHAGKALTTEYLLTGKLDVNAVQLTPANTPNNPHVEIAFSAGNRLLLWNGNGNDAFGLGWQAAGAHFGETAESGIEKWVFNGTDALTISFRLLVTDVNAYFYVDDLLELVAYNVPDLSRGLMIGSENAAITLYDLSCVKKGDAAYAAALEAREIEECEGATFTGNKLYTSYVDSTATRTTRYVAGGMGEIQGIEWDDDFILDGAPEGNTAYTDGTRDWLFSSDGKARFAGDLAFSYDVTLVDDSGNTLPAVTQYANNAFYIVTASLSTLRSGTGNGLWDNPLQMLYWKGAGATSARVTYGLNTEKATGLTAVTFRVTTARKANTLYLAISVGTEHYVQTVTLVESDLLTLWVGGAGWDFRIQNMTFTQDAAGVTGALSAIGITA